MPRCDLATCVCRGVSLDRSRGLLTSYARLSAGGGLGSGWLRVGFGDRRVKCTRVLRCEQRWEGFQCPQKRT